MAAELTKVAAERRRGDGRRERVWTTRRVRRRPIGDLGPVTVASALTLGASFLATGTARALLLGVGAGLLYVAIFLALGELLSGWRASRGRRGEPTVAPPAESRILRVMNEVMHVRPEPFSGRPERPHRAA